MIPLAVIPARLRAHVRLMRSVVVSAVPLAPARVRHGRPAFLALRGLGALVLAQAALRSGAGPAPIAGTLAGIATWLVITARADLAPSPGGQP